MSEINICNKNNSHGINQIPSFGINKDNNNSQNEMKYHDNIASYSISELDQKGTLPWWATIGGSIILASIIGFVFAKGGGNKFRTHLRNFNISIKDKINKKAKTNNFFKQLDNLFFKINKSSKLFTQISNTLTNYNPLKDSLTDKIFRYKNNKPGNFIADKLKTLFRNLSIKTVDSNYQKANAKFEDVLEKFSIASKNMNANEIVDIEGISKTKAEWQKIAETKIINAEDNFKTNFNKNERLKRRDFIDFELKDLDKKVFNKIYKENGGIFNKKNWKDFQEYITEKIPRKSKEKLLNDMTEKKSLISNNIDDTTSLIKELSISLKQSMNFEDTNSREIIRQMEKQLKTFKSLSGKEEKIRRTELSSAIKKELDELSNSIKSRNDYTPAEIAEITSKSDNIKKILNNDKKGELQEALTIVHSLTDEKNYKKFKKSVDKFSKELDNSIQSEGKSQFEKFAEYEVGSHTTDVLFGFIMPAGFAAYLIGKQKTKEERIETTLKQGVPIIGGLGMVFYGTSRMFSGAKNLLIGFGTTILLNLLGNFMNKTRKTYQEKQSLAQIALDAYKKNNLIE